MMNSEFEDQVLKAAYVLGRQRDGLMYEKRRLARKLRQAKHHSDLVLFSKNLDFAMCFFAAIGAIILIVFKGEGRAGDLIFPVLSLLSAIIAAGFGVRAQKMARRLKRFRERFGIDSPVISSRKILAFKNLKSKYRDLR
ncbi:hypothetical protein ACLBWS_00740 [Brucellaceae bacterium D45D]